MADSPPSRRRRAWSLRRRVLVASALGLAAALLAGIVAFAIALQAILLATVRESAHARAEQIASLVEDHGAGPAAAVAAMDPEDAVVQAIDANGRVLAASEEEAQLVPIVRLQPEPDEEIVQQRIGVADEDGPVLVLARGLETSGEERVTLVVAIPLETENRTVAVATALLGAGALVFGVAFLLLIARVLRSALRPVSRITSEVAAISAARGAERVTVPATGDEISRLAETMNGMLDRLSRSDAAVRRFVSDASHELRSPIATLRVQLETAPGGEAEARVDRALTLGEVERMHRLVDDLLTIAKADDRGLVLEREEVDLDDLVDCEGRRLRSISSGPVHVGIRPVQVLGDERRIAQILRNIADNALRHSEGWIRIGMEEPGDGRVRVHVDNAGAPIPLAERQRIFDRFVRLDEARARQHGGSGLGLSIAALFAEAHGGRVTAADAPGGGCRFTVELPVLRHGEAREGAAGGPRRSDGRVSGRAQHGDGSMAG
ncbi:MAG: HAMP domain-containing sensor histidine kinase [Pseudoclavibacter sp.]|nr:HAMP domain-containing sensor histidine kinase [Pseudoclavibacter sp.]